MRPERKLLVLWAFVGACGASPPGDRGAASDNAITEFVGVAQKGPFIRGTTVFISELDAELAQTGRTFITEIPKDTGSFAVRVDGLTGPYAKLIANGYYFDEVLGELSAAPLTLRAIVPTGAGASPEVSALSETAPTTTPVVDTRSARVNVNVLTDLEAPRVEYLVQHGTSFSDAKSQAQREVLGAFLVALGTYGVVPSESLDIMGGSPADTALLAISVLLQGYLPVGELSELLAVVGDDIRQDGTLDDRDARVLIKNAATLVSATAIREHVVRRYSELGISATPGDFKPVVTRVRDQATDPYVSRVVFPLLGAYGPNLLVGTTDERAAGDYSLAVVTPPRQPFRVHCAWLGAPLNPGTNDGWFISDHQNWSATLFDFGAGTQDFTVDDPGRPSDFSLMLHGHGSMRVDVIEGDAGAITSSRTLTW